MNPAKAIRQLRKALTIQREIGNLRSEAETLFNLSRALQKPGHSQEAISTAEAARTCYESVEDERSDDVRARLSEGLKADGQNET